jgi:hypothetical protein
MFSIPKLETKNGPHEVKVQGSQVAQALRPLLNTFTALALQSTIGDDEGISGEALRHIKTGLGLLKKQK